jgi:hypothetical protein
MMFSRILQNLMWSNLVGYSTYRTFLSDIILRFYCSPKSQEPWHRDTKILVKRLTILLNTCAVLWSSFIAHGRCHDKGVYKSGRKFTSRTKQLHFDMYPMEKLFIWADQNPLWRWKNFMLPKFILTAACKASVRLLLRGRRPSRRRDKGPLH